MSPSEKLVYLDLIVEAGADADEQDLDRLTRQFRSELEDLELESIERVPGSEPPAGAKTDQAVTLGMLAVAVLPTVVPKLIGFIQDWSMRGSNRAVKVKAQVGDRAVEVEYNPTTMSRDELKSLVEMLAGTLPPGEST